MTVRGATYSMRWAMAVEQKVLSRFLLVSKTWLVAVLVSSFGSSPIRMVCVTVCVPVQTFVGLNRKAREKAWNL